MKSYFLVNLLNEDQRAIRDFKSGKITRDDLRVTNKEINKKFISWVEKNNFPHENDNPDDYKAAIVLTLHSDLNFQKKILREAKRNNYIQSKDLAYLEDKILVQENKLQVYGTQYKNVSDGKVNFLPIFDPENLNERRAKVGLEPIEDYERKILDL